MIPADELDAMLDAQGVSVREKKVLSLALEGMPINDIAKELEIMPDAARKRLGEVYRKFGIKGRGSGKLAKLQQMLFAQYQSRETSTTIESASNDQKAPVQRVPVEWGNAPDLPQFFGREAEVQELSALILDPDIELISVVGMKGIGKTALVLKAIENLTAQFDGIFWRSLDSSHFQDVEKAMQECITYMRNESLTQEEECLNTFMDCLRHQRFLVIFDGVEDLLSPSDSTQETVDLVEDLIRRVGSERHLSCMVLTSRENPKAVTELEGVSYPVQSLFLEGVSAQAAKEILSRKNLTNKRYWDELIHIFQGNPLALQLIAVRIKRFFGGDVGEFLKQETITLHQIDDLIAHQFHSLSKEEKEVLSWLSLKHEALSFNELRSYINGSGAQLLETLEALVRRSLVQGEMQFIIHPTVQKYIRHFLQQEANVATLPENNAEIHALLERCLLLSHD